MIAPINETLLDAKLADLEKARAWSPRLISKLETWLRTADDYALFRVNPIQYAVEKGISEHEAIDLFLYATKFGLFQMDWHLVCMSCGNVVESFRTLSKVHSHYICNLCSIDNHVSLDDYIQVTFTISPQIRAISFHDPDSLSIEDLYFKYQTSKGILPYPNGVTVSQLFADWTKLLTYLEPGEKRTLELELYPGLLAVSNIRNSTSMALATPETPSEELRQITLQLHEDGFTLNGDPLAPAEFPMRGFMFKPSQFGMLSSNKVQVTVKNQTERRYPLWLLNLHLDFELVALEFEPFLCGKRLLSIQTFRDLFRTETVSTEEGIGVKDITFLFTDLKGSTALYDEVGDAKAFFLVRQHFDTLAHVIARNDGAVVKTIGDAVMATFMNPLDAVKAAAEMLADIEAFNQGITQKLILKIGIHQGHSIVVTLNDRLDYFGQTVNIAARVQGLADANEIYITADAFEYPGMAAVLADWHVTSQAVDVKGVSSKLHVYKIMTQEAVKS